MTRRKESMREKLRQAGLIILLLPIVLPLSAIGLSLLLLHHFVLYVLVWIVWLPKGKDVLLVYSNSPIWRDYMIQEILPLVQDRAVVLNWSERSKWSRWAFPVCIFRSFAGRQKYNPVVMLFRPFRRVQVFRFWSAFKDWKHGHTDPVNELRNHLLLKL